MKVAIVKYNAGNVSSVMHALDRLGAEHILTDNAEALRSADKVIFPGVGEAATTMDYLRSHGLDSIIKGLAQPVLGICLGQQLMCSHSEEGDVDCLGIFNVPVVRFRAASNEDKVPHMGWNGIECTGDALFKGFRRPESVYFVHSFYVPVCDWTIAQTTYINPFSAALHKDNFYATQFHPEKSGKIGGKILCNFLDL
ncbi:MAG: imidazole glycerol phosphate synthase subunit HisH [Bacteroidaceae bacterium]|nr:imidazole glycerol phosphate synthase subunit HisH [Bacteroidaceae bacterium]